jgi:hypothetical protein
MRCSLYLAVALALVACAEPTPSQPTVEGRVGSVSQKDIQEVIALIEREMLHTFGRTVPIDRVQVKDHNEIAFIYHYRGHEYWTVVRRIHGVWSPPTEHVLVTG